MHMICRNEFDFITAYVQQVPFTALTLPFYDNGFNLELAQIASDRTSGVRFFYSTRQRAFSPNG